MTVENTNNTISYTGNGSVDTFAYNFLVYQESHLFIYFDDILQTVGYTVTDIGEEDGGNVVFVTPPDIGVIIRIDRTVPETQLIEYQEYGPFPAKTNERGLDLLTMAVQQNSRDIEREFLDKMDKRPGADLNNIVVFDADGNSSDSGVNLSGFNVFSAANAKTYGAVGDGLNDDSDALQEWADVGGRLFLPRGLYRVTKQINFGPTTTVFGESAGGGTGGGEEATLIEEAAAGASIIYPDVTNWNGDDHVFLFENKNTDLKAAPSVVIQDLKIECPRAGGVEAHLLTVVNAYDALNIRNVNLIFCHKDYNALRLIEIDGTVFPTLSQTGVIQNVVAIGDDDCQDSIAPIIYMRRQQEMQMIGVKAFGIATALYDTCERIPLSLEGCRGITGVGCSAASTNSFGLDIHCTETSVEGIVFTGTTFELCDGGGFVIDSVTRNTGSQTVSNVVIDAPRYQFPQSIAGQIKGAEQCRVYVGTKQFETSDGATNNLIEGYNPSNFTNSVTGIAGRSNLYIAFPNAAGETYRFSEGLAVMRDSPAYDLICKDGSRGYRWLASISTAADNGLELRDAITQDILQTFLPNGQQLFNVGGQGPVLKTPSGSSDYEISVTESGDLFIRNNADSSDIHINNDRPATSNNITYTLSSVNIGGTVYKTQTNPNNVTIPTDATPITTNATVNVIAEGSGEVTIQGQSGVTLNGVLNGSCIIEGWEAGKFVGVTLIKRGSNDWMVVGANSAVS